MLFFLGYRGQGRLPGNRDLTQTHDGLTLSPTDCARLVRRTHSINRGGLSNPCGNETGHPSARTRFTVVELGTGLRYKDRTEVMFRSGAKTSFPLRGLINTLAHLRHLLFLDLFQVRLPCQVGVACVVVAFAIRDVWGISDGMYAPHHTIQSHNQRRFSMTAVIKLR